MVGAQVRTLVLGLARVRTLPTLYKVDNGATLAFQVSPGFTRAVHDGGESIDGSDCYPDRIVRCAFDALPQA